MLLRELLVLQAISQGGFGVDYKAKHAQHSTFWPLVKIRGGVGEISGSINEGLPTTEPLKYIWRPSTAWLLIRKEKKRTKIHQWSLGPNNIPVGRPNKSDDWICVFSGWFATDIIQTIVGFRGNRSRWIWCCVQSKACTIWHRCLQRTWCQETWRSVCKNCYSWTRMHYKAV